MTTDTNGQNQGSPSAISLLELLNDTEVLVRTAQREVAFAKYSAQDEGWPSLANYIEDLHSAFDPILDLIEDMFIDQIDDLYDELDTTIDSSQLGLIYRLVSALKESPGPSRTVSSSATVRSQDVGFSSDIPPDEHDDAAGLVAFLETAEVLIRTAQEDISTARSYADTEGRQELVGYIAKLEGRLIPILGTTFLMTKAELDDFIAMQQRNYDVTRLGLIYQQMNAIRALGRSVVE